ncbi:MAG: hypothetical protein AB7U05_09700 [Mangrovibacterium sp.]
MTIRYNVTRLGQPGQKNGGMYRYYPRISNRKKIGLDELATLIAGKCTLHQADLHAALSAFTEEIPNLLLENYSVELGRLGIFSLYAQCEGSDTPEAVNETNIQKVNMVFRAGNHIKKLLRTASFSKIPAK